MSDFNRFKIFLKKFWHFLWEENSVWSWIANVIIAFLLIKFIIYPFLGLVLGTGFPIVAVVSGSMEHHENIDQWWAKQQPLYEEFSITKEQFVDFPFSNGFNKGDIMVLRGVKDENLKIGDVIVFSSDRISEPVIHRVVKKQQEINDSKESFITTKGDFNTKIHEFEKKINTQNIIGKAALKIPYLGYIKIWFIDFLRLFYAVN